ncbi:MAG: N-acetylglucosamine-6-sulfatase [Nocardioidaceae bacterium]|nr:N-acetylglucosamine-6-sulfatase [Nocardioidaceae bacterium]
MLLLVSMLAIPSVTAPREAQAASRPPNVLLIMSDDQSYDTLGVMPAVQELQAEGTTFTRYYDSFPLCCPTRAAVLSGQYSHNNGVWDNTGRQGGYGALAEKNNTLARWLHDAGYRTAILGKLLNKYSMDTYGVPKGWDLFRVPQTAVYSYTKTVIRDESGNLTAYPGYRTDVYAQLAVDMLDQLGTTQPWFFWLAPNAPHTGNPVDPDDDPGVRSCSPSDVWRDHDQLAALPPTPAYNEEDVSDKPRHIRRLPPLTLEQQAAIHEAYTQQLECLRSLDTYVATVLAHLAATGQLANTDIIYVSDNGYAYGEHRVPRGKKLPYDYAAHLPLVAAGPDFPRAVDSSLRSSVDLTATILDVTGATPGHVVDGKSLLTPPDPYRAVLHEGRVVGSNSFNSHIRRYRGLRTQGWLYVHYYYQDGAEDYELYNTTDVPDQLTSLAADPRYRTIRGYFERWLANIDHCSGSECP